MSTLDDLKSALNSSRANLSAAQEHVLDALITHLEGVAGGGAGTGVDARLDALEDASTQAQGERDDLRTDLDKLRTQLMGHGHPPPGGGEPGGEEPGGEEPGGEEPGGEEPGGEEPGGEEPGGEEPGGEEPGGEEPGGEEPGGGSPPVPPPTGVHARPQEPTYSGQVHTVSNAQQLFDANKSANAGDIIKLAPGSYMNIPGGRGIQVKKELKFEAADPANPPVLGGGAEKGIFHLYDFTPSHMWATFKNLKFKNVGNSTNIACVRQQGMSLWMENCEAEDCDQGILGKDYTAEFTAKCVVINSKFRNCGYGGFSHGIYVDNDHLYIDGCTFWTNGNQTGHHIKSLGMILTVLNSTVGNKESRVSMAIDCSGKGSAELIENCKVILGTNGSNNKVYSRYASRPGQQSRYTPHFTIKNTDTINYRKGSGIETLTKNGTGAVCNYEGGSIKSHSGETFWVTWDQGRVNLSGGVDVQV